MSENKFGKFNKKCRFVYKAFKRIAKRMMHLEIASLKEYFGELMNNSIEASRLIKKDLITKFFKNEVALHVINKKVIPELLSKKETGDTVNVWIAGCSTGEEAYSFAILFQEYIYKNKLQINLKLFATEINKKALDIAARGVYPKSISKDISKQKLRKYFDIVKNNYAVKSDLKKLVIFAHHDIAKEPPFKKLDFVSCRNLSIDNQSQLHQKVLLNFQRSLKVGGYIFLDENENIGTHFNLFAEISTKWNIYKLTGRANNLSLDINTNTSVAKLQNKYNPQPRLKSFNIVESFNELVSEEYGLAGFLVDENFELKQAIGNYNKFILLPSKRLNLNLLKMLPVAISIFLRPALRKAIKQKEKVSIKSLKIDLENQQNSINIIVKPIFNLADSSAAALIIFNEIEALNIIKAEVHEGKSEKFSHDQFLDLELELKQTKENLLSEIEELGTSNEELQSSNEDLLSANEELQNSNEELQSLNEKLHTLNFEHQLKIKELIDSNDDLNNYLRNTKVGQIFLDKDLIVRKFTPNIIHQINVIESDIGRSITHLSNNLNYPLLADDILNTIKYDLIQEKEVKANSGHSYQMKICPYISRDKKNDGAVVTFIDISDQKESNNLLQKVLETVPNALFFFKAVRSETGKVTDFEGTFSNNRCEDYLEIESAKFSGKKIKKDNLNHLPFLRDFIEVFEQDTFISKRYFSELYKKHYLLHAEKVNEGIVVTLTDISENVLLEEERDRTYKESLQVKEQLSELNTRLETIVVERSNELEKSEDRLRLLSKATNDAIWDWNLIDKKIWWNDGYFKLFGYKAQYTNNGSKPWQDLVHPNDYQKVIDGLDNAIEHKSDTWAEKFRFLKADGTYAFVFSRAIITYDKSGVPQRLVGSMMDITEIKNMQEELVHSMERVRFIAESMPQKVWTASSKGDIQYMNERWLTYTGLSFNELKDWKWQNVIHRDDIFDTTRLWKQSLETGQDFQIEHRIMRHDAKFRWHLTRGIACRGTNGNVISWVGTNTDIHDKILAGERKDEFIGVASHELKTPLTSLKAYTQLLERTIADKNFEESDLYIKKTNVFIDRLDELISDLLDVSKIQSGQLQYNMSNFYFDDLVKESIDHLKQTNKTHKINLKGKTGVKIIGDKARLEQVFSNYLSNAIKYSPKANKIDVEVNHTSKGISVGIRDYGIGIPPEKIENIFKRFYRVEGMDHRFQGLGLGLFIASQIVHRHGGKCWVDSEEDVGSVFWFELPESCIVS
jgi:two-component system, chemotaxis family, CheB/CheR fusion protein